MTITGFPPCAHRAIIGLPLTLAVVLSSGCGNGGAGPSTAQGPTATVTAAPTRTAGVSPQAAAAAAAQSAARRAGIAKSDVAGRKFDLGTIVRVEDGGGVQVIIFDRWTVRGVADSALAARGMSIGVHSDAPYQNLNSKITYRIPVAQGAFFTYRHCVAKEQPPAQKSSTVEDFARLRDPEQVILLTLDQHGQVFSAQNDPAC
jgi:hypothetical protein